MGPIEKRMNRNTLSASSTSLVDQKFIGLIFAHLSERRHFEQKRDSVALMERSTVQCTPFFEARDIGK